MAAFSIKIDTSGLDNFTKALSRISPESIGEAMVDTVNEAADRTFLLARETMLSGINMTDAYIVRKMERKKATKASPSAEIIAPATRKKGRTNPFTNLSHYDAQQLTKPVNWTNERIAAERGPKAFGKWRKWTPRDGDAKRGIDAGEKAHKLSVEVIRGARKNVAKTFTLPGLRDNDGNPLVFQRKDGGRIDALLGPSVFQLFRVAAGKIEDTVSEDLRDAVIRTAERELEKVLK